MAGTIKSSKPTLEDITSTSPSASVLSVNREGVLMERGGPIYMTHTFMIGTNTTVASGARLSGASLVLAKDDDCCPGLDYVTDASIDVSALDTITNVEVVDVTEEIFLPILFTDSYGNLMPVIRSSTAEDVYGGVPLRRRL